jgi:hypothetical protein
MAAISYIGGTVAVSVATPGTVDASGFGALTYTVVGNMISFGETGDEAADISIPLLSGRTLHVNGAKDGGSRKFAYQYELSDAGQVLIRANTNNNTDVSVKITDPDGKIEYFYGRIANLKRSERTSAAFKGESGEFRVNSAVVIV